MKFITKKKKRKGLWLKENTSPEKCKAVAKKLMDKGYYVVSRAWNNLSRLDKKNWMTIMADNHPYHTVEFYQKDPTQWADHYRRCYSKDIIEVPEEIRRYVTNSGVGSPEFKKIRRSKKKKRSEKCETSNNS